jgi:hypothetical protein
MIQKPKVHVLWDVNGYYLKVMAREEYYYSPDGTPSWVYFKSHAQKFSSLKRVLMEAEKLNLEVFRFDYRAKIVKYNKKFLLKVSNRFYLRKWPRIKSVILVQNISSARKFDTFEQAKAVTYENLFWLDIDLPQSVD